LRVCRSCLPSNEKQSCSVYVVILLCNILTVSPFILLFFCYLRLYVSHNDRTQFINYSSTIQQSFAVHFKVIKLIPPANRIHRHSFLSSCDLDLDPMTLISELNLDILKMYLYTKDEFSRSGPSKVTSLQPNTHRYRCD